MCAIVPLSIRCLVSRAAPAPAHEGLAHLEPARDGGRRQPEVDLRLIVISRPLVCVQDVLQQTPRAAELRGHRLLEPEAKARPEHGLHDALDERALERMAAVTGRDEVERAIDEGPRQVRDPRGCDRSGSVDRGDTARPALEGDLEQLAKDAPAAEIALRGEHDQAVTVVAGRNLHLGWRPVGRLGIDDDDPAPQAGQLAAERHARGPDDLADLGGLAGHRHADDHVGGGLVISRGGAGVRTSRSHKARGSGSTAAP